MLYLLVLLVLTLLVLAALLWGGTQLAQGAWYEEPPTGLYWRAPAAAGAVTAFYLAWCLLNYVGSEPGQKEPPYGSLIDFTSEKVSDPVPEFVAIRGSREERYRIKRLGGTPQRHEYRDEMNDLWQSSRAREAEAIVVKIDKQTVRFKPVKGQDNEIVFVEEGGRRVLSQGGRITTPLTGSLLLTVLLNLVHLGVWFAAVWLLLRFQWPHALGLAALFWLVMTFVVPNALLPKALKPAATAATSLPAGAKSPSTPRDLALTWRRLLQSTQALAQATPGLAPSYVPRELAPASCGIMIRT